MDGKLVILLPFQTIPVSVISKQQEGDNERLCARELIYG